MSVRWRTVATRPVCHHRETISSGQRQPVPPPPQGTRGRDDDVSIGLYRLAGASAGSDGMVVGIWVLVLVGARRCRGHVRRPL